MTDSVRDDLAAILPPLLQSIEALGFVARYLHPPSFGTVMEMAGEPDAPLRAALDRLAGWPEPMQALGERLRSASDAVIAGFDGLRRAPEQENAIVAVYRSLRYLPRAQEALYPLATVIPVIGRFFVDPGLRDDADVQARIAAAVRRDDVGILHSNDEPGSRGSFSIYVPEYYTPDRKWPLVVALHGGSGNGRAFLWSWLRDARSRGAIVVTPTAVGQTWALMGDDADTPNLNHIVELIRSRWTIDETRMLLTGMSDGGTFSYVSGLESGSRFTHLAPVAASFHPLMAEMADSDRLRGLPIHITHGELDWMFPVQIARDAEQSLRAAGAEVTYREIDDLSHAYPREVNADILHWLSSSRREELPIL